MSDAAATDIGNSSPTEAWEALASNANAVLIDVRTRAEWTFVGTPDLGGAAGTMAFIEWTQFPTMSPNPGFIDACAQAVAEASASQAYFICRSGARSGAAATTMQQVFARSGMDVACFNVAEGFEGDLDGHGRRGAVNGWKVRGLPWRQS